MFREKRIIRDTILLTTGLGFSEDRDFKRAFRFFFVDASVEKCRDGLLDSRD
jgi:hypothetical protein